MRVTLAFAPTPRDMVEESVEVPDNTTLVDALILAGWRDRFGLDRCTDLEFGVWNHKAALHTVLKPMDRVEIYRPLTVDPKKARRERFHKQGAKTAGLFARRRPGAKPGY